MLGVVEADMDKKNKVQNRDLDKLHLIGSTLKSATWIKRC